MLISSAMLKPRQNRIIRLDVVSSDLVQSSCWSSTGQCRLSRATSAQVLEWLQGWRLHSPPGPGFTAAHPGLGCEAEPGQCVFHRESRHGSQRPALEGRTGCGKRGSERGQPGWAGTGDSPSQKHSGWAPFTTLDSFSRSGHIPEVRPLQKKGMGVCCRWCHKKWGRKWAFTVREGGAEWPKLVPSEHRDNRRVWTGKSECHVNKKWARNSQSFAETVVCTCVKDWLHSCWPNKAIGLQLCRVQSKARGGLPLLFPCSCSQLSTSETWSWNPTSAEL